MKIEKKEIARLPVKIRDGTRADLEALGIRFPENTEKNPLYMTAVLPLGWGEGRWWQNWDRGPHSRTLLDAEDRRRAVITSWVNLSGGDAWIRMEKSIPQKECGHGC